MSGRGPGKRARILLLFVNFTRDVNFSPGQIFLCCVLLSLPRLAQGQSGPVAIHCDELSAEERARVEVRLLTELRTLPNPPGVLELTCENGAVRGGWLQGGTLHDARNLSVAPGDSQTEMLLWIASLLLETEGDRVAGAPGATRPPPPVSLPVPEGGAVPPSGVSPAPEPAPEAAPTTAATTALPSPADSEPSQSDERKTRPPEEAVSIEAGLSYAHYGAELDGALGPHLGGHLPVFGPFGATWAASVLFGTEEPASLNTLEGAFFLGADWAPLSVLRLSLGPSLSWARVADATIAHESLTFGIETSLKAVFPRPLGFFAQAGIRGLADERRVVWTDPNSAPGASATFIPHWSLFFALGGSLDLHLR